MRIDILTLFPEMCCEVLRESVIGRARERGCVEINCRNIRDYTLDKHNRVDDSPYGGGTGMIMQVQPIYDCYESLCRDTGTRPHLIYLTPQGKTLTQKRVVELSKLDNIALLCGHYEGIDERVIEEIVDEEISIGAREPFFVPARISSVYPPCRMARQRGAARSALGSPCEHREVAQGTEP